MAQRPTLTTDRLILRPFTLADCPAVQHLAGDRAIADTTLNIPHPYPDGGAAEWINTHQGNFDRGEGVQLAVTLRTDGVLIGGIGLVIKAAHRHGELGYWIGRPYWGRGYCTEAARAMVDYGFVALNLWRIYAYHFARNPQSGRVMQKIGMKHEGRQPGHVFKWDRPEDIDLYGILRCDWGKAAGDRSDLKSEISNLRSVVFG